MNSLHEIQIKISEKSLEKKKTITSRVLDCYGFLSLVFRRRNLRKKRKI